MVKANELCCICESDKEKIEFINKYCIFVPNKSHVLMKKKNNNSTPFFLLHIIYERSTKGV